MSRIDELLERLAPDGVPFVPLGDIGRFQRGNGLQRKDLTESGIGAIHYGQVFTHYGTWATTTKSFVTPDTAVTLRRAAPGDLVIATTSENDEDVCKAVAWLGEEPVVVSGDAYVFSHSLDPKFVAYFFQSTPFRVQKARHITGTKVRRVSGEALATIRLPVPPREVQAEVVRILDSFRELEADLEAELEARRAQYAHYRDSLMLSVIAPRLPLGEVGEFLRGRRFVKDDYVDDGIPCIHYGEIYTHYGTAATTALSRVRTNLAPILRYAKPGDVILTDVGETVDDVGKAVAWLGSEEVAIHDHCYAFRHSMDPRFVSHYMQTSMHRAAKARHVARTKVKTLLIEGFSRVTIPVPPAEEQRRIATILDSFDALVNDLSSGLPAEIAARRRQYVHYRDRLLTFEEAR